MGRTGKLYNLTVGSALLTVVSCVLIATWNENTPKFDLWFDIVPHGFGGASVITTLLIVGCHQATFDRQ
jgi:hypothetical protein